MFSIRRRGTHHQARGAEIICVLSSLLIASLASPARAEQVSLGAPAGSCAEAPGCAALAEEGRELSKRGQFDAACERYQRAYALLADPVLLFNLGRMHHKMSRWHEASEHYRRYLQAAPKDEPEQRQKAESYLLEVSERERMGGTGEQRNGRPLYKQWWLWTLVGVGVAGIATGVALGIATRAPDFGNSTQYHPFGS